jgi:hypothetical protein
LSKTAGSGSVLSESGSTTLVLIVNSTGSNIEIFLIRVIVPDIIVPNQKLKKYHTGKRIG